MADRIVVQCPGCSAKLKILDERKLGKTIRCPKCAETFLFGAIKVCSAKVSTAAKEANPPPTNIGVTQKQTTTHRTLVITAILAITLSVGVGALVVLGRKSDPTRPVVSPQPVAKPLPPPTKWRIGETEPVTALNPEEIPERLTLDAVTGWNWFKDLRRPDESDYLIDVVLQLRGELVERICQFGEVRISSSSLDSGEEVKLFSEKSALVFDPTIQWIPFDTKIPLTHTDPPGFLRIPIRIERPKNMNARLSKFEGDFKIRVADRIDEFTIEEVAKVVENPIGIPALDAAGVRFNWNREQEGRYESVEMIVGDGYSAGRFVVTDAGQPINDLFLNFQKFSNHRSAEGETVVRIIRNMHKPLPERLRLRFSLFSNLREVVVPFRFANLALPSLESRPKIGK